MRWSGCGRRLTVRSLPRLTYYHVRTCDACGSGSRETEMVALGRNGLSVLTAQLCPRCSSTVELAVERAIGSIETDRLERELAVRRGR
jgi:hypothetical protein